MTRYDPGVYLGAFPAKVQRALDTISPGVSGNAFPAAGAIDCPLSTYLKIVCALVDVPVEPPGGLVELIKASNILFNMYCTIKKDGEMCNT